jgi:diaminopimelate epimerase
MHMAMQHGKNLNFEKWQATGNDFIICSEQRAEEFTEDLSALAKSICDRHFGVGADGLLLLEKKEESDFRMRMWNPDGSESEMCGNGLRCIGAHLLAHGLVDGSAHVKIQTSNRTINVEFRKPAEWATADRFWVRSDMGVPVLERSEIPIGGSGKSPVIEEDLEIPYFHRWVNFTGVGFGNPHAVIFITGIDDVPLRDWGPAIENHTELFPSRVNVEFVQIITPEHVRMRVWERGAGATLSCGSGTAAVQVACHLTGKAGDRLRVDVPGGSLETEYSPEGRVYLSGPAKRVFIGDWLC